MTRIIGGAHRGRRLRTPRGEATRPTSDRVREALFSSLESHWGSLDGLAVLDLYAGSAALALEAMSRGAARGVAVEADRRTARIAAGNAADLGAELEVVAGPVVRFLAGPARSRFDVVFADPPYPLATEEVDRVLGRLVRGGWLADGASVVVERASRSASLTAPDGLAAERERRYGETVLWYFRCESDVSRSDTGPQE